MHLFLTQISWGPLHSESGQLHGVEGRHRPLLHLHFYETISDIKTDYKLSRHISIVIDI